MYFRVTDHYENSENNEINYKIITENNVKMKIERTH